MNGTPNLEPFRDGSDWFEQRRDHFMRRLVDDFFLLMESFQQLYKGYLECRTPGNEMCTDLLSPETEISRTRIWNRVTRMIGSETEKGPLWELKDLCHMIWPEQEHQYDVHGSLVDWLLGSVFHEAMKLKENIYLLNIYGPAAIRIRELPEAGGLRVLQPSGPFPRFSSMVDVEGLVRRIADDVISQMEQIGFLLGQANFILRVMMPELGGNLLIVRLLVEREERVRELWGESVEELFGDMFFDNPAKGFCLAAASYFSGQWYPRALEMYERALRVDPGCGEALAKTTHLRAMLEENPRLGDWGNIPVDSGIVQ